MTGRGNFATRFKHVQVVASPLNPFQAGGGVVKR
jgi:hypothetical protein